MHTLASAALCPKKREKMGLSLLEVVVAVGVLAVAALGIIAALTRIVVAQGTSSHQTVAHIIGDSALRDAAIAGPPEDSDYIAGVVQSKYVRVGQTDALAEFQYQVVYRRLPPYVGEESGPDMGRMWQFRVLVWWNSQDGPESAVERGQQRLSVGRMVYIEE